MGLRHILPQSTGGEAKGTVGVQHWTLNMLSVCHMNVCRVGGRVARRMRSSVRFRSVDCRAEEVQLYVFFDERYGVLSNGCFGLRDRTFA